MLVRYMATNEISEYAANEDVGGKVSAVGNPSRSHESGQAISGRRHPRAVAMSFRDHRREGPCRGCVAGGKRISTCEELAIGVVNADSSAGLRRPWALGDDFQNLDDS